jgi:surface polysaccharide O-acyltransferase-like enzyme
MQLWFLPFLLGISLILFVPVREATRHPWIAVAIAVLAGALCAVRSGIGLDPGATDTNWFAFVGFLQYSLFAMPAIFWGIAAAFLFDQIRRPLLGWVGLAIWFVCLCVVIRGPRNALMENLAGVGLLVACLNFGPISAGFGKYAFLAYGIYLSHAVFLETIQGALHRWSGPAGTFLIFFATLALSVACSMALHRSSRTRWMLG